MIRRLGGHLGSNVSALIDGQLDAETTERSWDHVLHCAACRGLVEREAWLKRKLGTLCGNEPSARLLGSLHGLSADGAQSAPTWAGLEAWAEVDRLEASSRGRRRTGLALAGAGGVSAAVLGFAALGFGGAAQLAPNASISGGASSSTPTSAVVPAVAVVHGRLPGLRVGEDASTSRVTRALAHR